MTKRYRRKEGLPLPEKRIIDGKTWNMDRVFKYKMHTDGAKEQWARIGYNCRVFKIHNRYESKGYVTYISKKVKRKSGKKSKKGGLRQTGKTNKTRDSKLTAKRPGRRISKKGKKYTERRANRSDKSKTKKL